MIDFKKIDFKKLTSKELQSILREYFDSPNCCFGIEFIATMDHDASTEHKVKATLFLDDNGFNLNQLVLHEKLDKNYD